MFKKIPSFYRVIRNGLGELDDPGASTCRESHALYDPLQNGFAILAQRAVFLDLPVVHGCIAEYSVRTLLIRLSSSQWNL